MKMFKIFPKSSCLSPHRHQTFELTSRAIQKYAWLVIIRSESFGQEPFISIEGLLFIETDNFSQEKIFSFVV